MFPPDLDHQWFAESVSVLNSRRDCQFSTCFDDRSSEGAPSVNMGLAFHADHRRHLADVQSRLIARTSSNARHSWQSLYSVFLC
jgi:hypothetical protein